MSDSKRLDEALEMWARFGPKRGDNPGTPLSDINVIVDAARAYADMSASAEHPRGLWVKTQEAESENGNVRQRVFRPATYRDLLANGQRVEPDYEAALAEYLRLRWAEDGMGPYAEELADVVLPNGVTVPRISNFEETKRIVDAAIGDKLLIDPPTEEERDE